MKHATSPIEMLIDRGDMRCTICNAKAGTCECWIICDCGHSYQRGETCPSSVHVFGACAGELAIGAAANVIGAMRSLYPEPMKFASGGFQKTLRANIEREIRETVLEILKAKDEAEKS